MTVIARDDQGTPTVWCDPCIAPLVAALNTGGVATTWSCCGHGRRPGAIGLADGRQLHVLPDLDALHAFDHLWPGINDEPATAQIVELSTLKAARPESHKEQIARAIEAGPWGRGMPNAMHQEAIRACARIARTVSISTESEN
jgi:hypothetical protein